LPPELSDVIAAMREDCITDLVRQYVPAESVEEQWDLAALEKVLADEWQVADCSCSMGEPPSPSPTRKFWSSCQAGACCV
jgi:preprotein translocase subunit SecA